MLDGVRLIKFGSDEEDNNFGADSIGIYEGGGSTGLRVLKTLFFLVTFSLFVSVEAWKYKSCADNPLVTPLVTVIEHSLVRDYGGGLGHVGLDVQRPQWKGEELL